MGNSGVSSLILVIAGLIIATIAATVAFDVAYIFSEDILKLAGLYSTQLSVDISILSSPDYVYDEDTEDLDIFVKNTGSQSIEIGDDTGPIDTFVNGQYLLPDEVEIREGQDTVWGEGEVIKLTWNELDEIEINSENTVSVLVEQNEDDLVFFVPE